MGTVWPVLRCIALTSLYKTFLGALPADSVAVVRSRPLSHGATSVTVNDLMETMKDL